MSWNARLWALTGAFFWCYLRLWSFSYSLSSESSWISLQSFCFLMFQLRALPASSSGHSRPTSRTAAVYPPLSVCTCSDRVLGTPRPPSVGAVGLYVDCGIRWKDSRVCPFGFLSSVQPLQENTTMVVGVRGGRTGEGFFMSGGQLQPCCCVSPWGSVQD